MIRDKKWQMLVASMCLIIFNLIWQNFDNDKNKKIKIGIIQFIEHEALDASRLGFIDGLNKYNLDYKIDYKNAQGDQANCTLISNWFVSKEYDLILAIATPAAQAVAAVTNKIPILVTAITNPEGAGIVKSNQNPQNNVTGTSDLVTVSKQIELIKKIKPKSQKIGILLSSNESNSEYQAKIAFEEAQKIGLQPKIFTFSQMTEIQQVVELVSTKVDAIYTPTDNMVASNMELISKTALSNKIPVICSETNLILKGATATFGMDYFELGKLTAKKAIEILKYKKSPKDMPIEYLENLKFSLNFEVIEKLDLEDDIKNDFMKNFNN